MIPPGSIIYMKEGLYLSAAGIIEHFNPQTGRYGVCLFRRDICIWARASEFVVLAILWSGTLFPPPGSADFNGRRYLGSRSGVRRRGYYVE